MRQCKHIGSDRNRVCALHSASEEKKRSRLTTQWLAPEEARPRLADLLPPPDLLLPPEAPPKPPVLPTTLPEALQPAVVVREVIVGAADTSGCNVGLNDLHPLLALLPLLLLL